METKKCSKCGVEKPLTEEYWPKDRRYKYGLYIYVCRICTLDYARRLYRENHPKKDFVIPKTRVCMKCKKEKPFTLEFFCKNEKLRSGLTSWCRECIREEDKQRHKKMKERDPQKYIEIARKAGRKYEENNREKRRLKNKLYREKNKEKIKLYRKKLMSKSEYRIENNLRRRLLKYVKQNKRVDSFKNLLGCTIKYLKEHLQKTATENGYTDFNIENYDGKLYNIDHIIPLSIWNFNCGFHQRLAFNWKNLQMLKADKNFQKSDKMFVNLFVN